MPVHYKRLAQKTYRDAEKSYSIQNRSPVIGFVMEHNCRADKGSFDHHSRAAWHEKSATKERIERILCIDENGIKLFLRPGLHWQPNLA